jgi:hypothetical protein
MKLRFTDAIENLLGERQRGRQREGPRGNMSDEDPALTIALFEYESIRELLILGNTQTAARFNYLIFLSAAVIAGSGAIAGGSAMSAAARLAVIAALTLLLTAIGLLTFERIVRFDIVRLEYLAMMGLYRGYLLERAPQLKPYTILPVQRPGEPRSSWPVQSALSNLAHATALINSAAMATATAALGLLTLRSTTYSVAIGASTLCLGVLTHGVWQREIRKAGEAALNRLLLSRATLKVESSQSQGALSGR